MQRQDSFQQKKHLRFSFKQQNVRQVSQSYRIDNSKNDSCNIISIPRMGLDVLVEVQGGFKSGNRGDKV